MTVTYDVATERWTAVEGCVSVSGPNRPEVVERALELLWRLEELRLHRCSFALTESPEDFSLAIRGIKDGNHTCL